MTYPIARVLGLAALVVGVVLLVFAFNASNAPVEQIASGLTGHYTDETMGFLLAGVAATVGGTALLFAGRR